ncbi:MAG: FAD:protein FMN transferase [Kiritimatiellaeota bacterium]|nr:FAD:protein FMN transferase [Kiritimatiellota bacterium]
MPFPSQTNPQPVRGQAARRPARIRAAVLVVVVLGLVAVLFRNAGRGERNRRGEPRPFTVAFPVFGTVGRVKFWAPEEQAARAAEAVETELFALQRAINVYDPKSELSRLNAAAAERPVACSERLWLVIEAARRAWRETGGAFDVSVGPLMDLWGFHRKRRSLPSEAEIRQAREKVGLTKVLFDDRARTVAFTVPGMFLDMGGIAKGYALDVAVRLAVENGIRRGLIDLGGNIRCLSEPPPGRDAYEIGVRDPFDVKRMIGTVAVTGAAVATSGNYEQFVVLDGRRFTHIVDPTTGRPVQDVAAVSVLTPRGVDSDVFSTAIFVAGASLARRFVETHPGSGVLIVTVHDGERPKLEQWGWRWHTKLPPLLRIEAGLRPAKRSP